MVCHPSHMQNAWPTGKISEYHVVVITIRRLRTGKNCPAKHSLPSYVKNEQFIYLASLLHDFYFWLIRSFTDTTYTSSFFVCGPLHHLYLTFFSDSLCRLLRNTAKTESWAGIRRNKEAFQYLVAEFSPEKIPIQKGRGCSPEILKRIPKMYHDHVMWVS